LPAREQRRGHKPHHAAHLNIPPGWYFEVGCALLTYARDRPLAYAILEHMDADGNHLRSIEPMAPFVPAPNVPYQLMLFCATRSMPSSGGACWWCLTRRWKNAPTAYCKTY